jgi:hypothetical protein
MENSQSGDQALPSTTGAQHLQPHRPTEYYTSD